MLRSIGLAFILFLIGSGARAGMQESMEFLKDRPSRRLHGPNCWNSALYVSGLAKHVRFTSNQEFHVLMESPYCQTTASPQVGSIKVYRVGLREVTGPQTEVHAAVWLGDGVLFNKMTALSTSVYQTELDEDVNRVYQQLPSIVRIPIINKAGNMQTIHCSGQECENQIIYKNCQTLVSIENDFVRPELVILYRKIGELESDVASVLFRDRLPPSSFFTRHLEQIGHLEEQLAFLRASSAIEDWQLNYLATLLVSLRKQLTMNQPNWL